MNTGDIFLKIFNRKIFKLPVTKLYLLITRSHAGARERILFITALIPRQNSREKTDGETHLKNRFTVKRLCKPFPVRFSRTV